MLHTAMERLLYINKTTKILEIDKILQDIKENIDILCNARSSTGSDIVYDHYMRQLIV